MKSIALIIFLALGLQAGAQFVVETSGQIADHTPYHCLVRVTASVGPTSDDIHGCVIISPKHVLTAASIIYMHLAWHAADFHVGVGSNRQDQLIYFAIQTWHMHPSYQHVSKRWNFAAFTLQHSLTFSSFVQAAVLPPLGDHGPLSQEQGQFSSYATDSGVLKTSYVRINNEIDYMGEDTTIWGEFEPFNGEPQCIDIAAGSALIVRHFGVDTIMGLSSFGYSCGSTQPMYIARITRARSWIRTELGI